MRTLLPDAPMIQKAYYCPPRSSVLLEEPLPTLMFGTLFTPSRDQEAQRINANGRPIDLVCPEAGEMMRKGYKTLDLPPGWEVRLYLSSHLASLLTSFAALWFEVEHGLKFKHPRGGRMPEQVLWLLSDSMQTGKRWTYRNYQKYCRLEGLKFLPFLITHDHFRFFVFRPTAERVEMAIKAFDQALSRIQREECLNYSGLIHRANDVFYDVRVTEIPELEGLHRGSPTKSVAFLLKDLKGSPQDATRFNPS